MAGWVDISEALGAGIYLLFKGDRVVYVGKAQRQMLSLIQQHRDLATKSVPDWFPVKGIAFDRVWIKYVPVHLLAQEYEQAVAQYAPTYSKIGASLIRRVA